MMKSVLLSASALALAMFAGAPVHAQSFTGKGSETTEPNRNFAGEDLFDLASASDPQISPDGQTIIYVRRQADIMKDRTGSSLWAIDVASGEQMPFAASDAGAFSPRWSPDGSRVAYVSTEGGSAQMWVKWVKGGEAVKLTGLPNSPSSMAWSPDGKTIAYTMLIEDSGPKLGSAPSNRPEGAQWAEPLDITDLINFRADGAGELKPGYEKIFAISSTGGAPRQLTFGASHDSGPLSWSPDGKSIYFTSNRNSDWQIDVQELDVWKVDVASLSPTRVTNRDGIEGGPAVSPDGRMIAYSGYADEGKAYEQTELTIMDISGGNPRVITQGWDFSVDGYQWDADSRGIYVQYDQRGQTKVARIGLDGSVRNVVDGLSGGAQDRPYTGGSFSVADDDTIAFTGGDAQRPGEVKVSGKGGVRALTDLNPQLRTSKNLGAVREITVASSYDGKEVQGWLTLPPGYTEGTRVPLILEIHGGPFSAYGPHFATDNQLYAAKGYAVLSANPRGSTSYGEAFAQAIDKAYPSQDYDDLMSIVDRAIELGVADPDKLFVTGGSGGGVLTAWIVGKTDRFKAAASQKPVINWTTQALTADGTGYFGPYWVGSHPWENPEKFWAQSPLSLVGNVKTPTLVVVGAEDHRTPVSEAQQFYSALRLRGVPSAFIRVPGASHAITARPSQAAAKASAILAWFERYAEGAPK